MPLFEPNYETPGPGVPEGEPQKHGIQRYFVVAIRKFWDLVVLNLLYFITSIIAVLAYAVIGWLFLGDVGRSVGSAIVAENIGATELLQLQEGIHLVLSICFGFLMTALLGSGGPRAGMSYVLRNYSQEEHAFLWSDFKEYTLKNFLKGAVVFAIDLIFVFVICLDIYTYAHQESFAGLIATYFAIFIFLIYILMHAYIYMLMVTFDMKLKSIYKNAFLLTASRIPQNLGCFICAAAMLLIMLDMVYKWNVLLFLLFIVFYSFPCLILDMNSFSVVKKYMIKDKAD